MCLRPVRYWFSLVCHHGVAECEGRAVWTLVSATCYLVHPDLVWCFCKWYSRRRADSYIFPKYYIVNPLYTDTRYNDKNRYNDNLYVKKPSLKR